MRIRSSMLALTLSLAALAAAPAFAAAAKPMTTQQQKMADCSHQSKGMKGDAHKQFMSNCLKGKSDMAASSDKMSQQDKMKSCNAQAGKEKLKGDARKGFMSGCLKSDKGAMATAPVAASTAAPMASGGKMSQQDKMKTCNAAVKSKGLKGTERKAFMSTCLKG